MIPPQGFRHAATLLLTNRARTIPSDASAETLRTALEHLASELVALAKDMRVRAEVAGWLITEVDTMVDRLPQSFDRAATKAMGKRHDRIPSPGVGEKRRIRAGLHVRDDAPRRQRIVGSGIVCDGGVAGQQHKRYLRSGK